MRFRASNLALLQRERWAGCATSCRPMRNGEADVSRTQIVAEGPSGANGVSRSLVLQAPEPENPNPRSQRDSVGDLWINVDDGSVMNVQLSQFEGRLQELYVLFVDPKHPKRKLPETWTEVSREAADL